MKIYTLENESVRIRVSALGAELQSLYSKKFAREYMWQKNETWEGHSLLLFPTAGRVKRSRAFVRGAEYPMAMHGFIKDAEFNVIPSDAGSLVLESSANDETRISFPYDFTFRVTFTLDGESVCEAFEIVNNGADDMYFGFGAHPGFFCPIVLGETAEDYVLEFDRPQDISEYEYEPQSRLLTHATRPFITGSSAKPLSEHFFDNGPVVADGMRADWIQLRSKKSGRFVRIAVKDFPQLTLWGRGGCMSVFCIEPWCGTSDFMDADCVWEKKYGNNRIAPGAVFQRRLVFTIG